MTAKPGTSAAFNNEMINMTVGHWIWKDDTNTLEFVSNNPLADKKERAKNRKLQKDHGKTVASERPTGANMGKPAGGPKDKPRPLGVPAGSGKSPLGRGKHKGHTTVTLEDVKTIALGMLSASENIDASFEDLCQTEQFDNFLVYLLNYYACFFEKRAYEKKPNPMNIEPGRAEKMLIADMVSKLDEASKLLGQAYGTLVLGIGLEPVHHMRCGSSRVSATYRDRSMYETFYAVCAFIVWIAFRRKEDYEAIKVELGRMLRSSTFNHAARAKNVTVGHLGEPPRSGMVALNRPEAITLSPAQYRRQFGNRPAIKSIITQRSPVLVAIMPTPKEESPWLYRQKFPGVVRTSKCGDLHSHPVHFKMDPKKLKIGIIGERLIQFNPITLTPLGADTEEEERGEDDEKTGSATTKESTVVPSKSPLSAGHIGETSASRISQATTEVTSDED
ncbi:hypothetical protein LSAT2_007341 [Lamellibrachia satsuma]|nr:hypothetical protein LSAT2_007341 [Lamellibrachia satsuma]